MKRLIAVLIVLIITSNFSFAQFKEGDNKNPSSYKPYNKSSNNLILGFINPKNFTMNHSFNVSMMSSGYGNVSLTSYINTMNYRISDRFNVSADVKVQYSPFASSNFGQSNLGSLENNLNGVFLSRASMNYIISDYSSINFEYRRIDQSDYYNNDFYNPFYSNSGYNSGWR
ncbi:MAG: hypothetical protein M3R36_12670 [Bacteroidota bacterium]|nr:hypothetical protein [Bacteroidota bacterium]